MLRLNGKVALVSGGARGIGAATVRAMVAEGASVVIGDVLATEGQARARELGGSTAFAHLDVTRPESWEMAVAATLRIFGRLDILVNNAGIARFGRTDTHGRADWDQVIAINLTGVFLGIQAAVPAMRQGGGGSIVNVSSIAGLRGFPQVPAYVASKFGVRGLTKAAALDLAADNIRVNSVHPGFVRTALIADGPEPPTGHVAMHRLGDAAEIASLIVFVASDDASFATGAEFVADGGATAGNAAQFA
ncbi:MAG: glucose 1-dehydrogenase [Pseudomonadota bacterium]